MEIDEAVWNGLQCPMIHVYHRLVICAENEALGFPVDDPTLGLAIGCSLTRAGVFAAMQTIPIEVIETYAERLGRDIRRINLQEIPERPPTKRGRPRQRAAKKRANRNRRRLADQSKKKNR